MLRVGVCVSLELKVQKNSRGLRTDEHRLRQTRVRPVPHKGIVKLPFGFLAIFVLRCASRQVTALRCAPVTGDDPAPRDEAFHTRRSAVAGRNGVTIQAPLCVTQVAC